MRKVDLYTKVILSLIAVCLLYLVFHVTELSLIPSVSADMGKINFAKDGGVGIACSSDGKYVYIAGSEGVIRSDDYGRLGSWEKTLKED